VRWTVLLGPGLLARPLRQCVQHVLRSARAQRLGLGLVAAAALVPPASAGPFPAVFELASLAGTNGFVLHGFDAGDSCGTR
jgi:hypothetical protein